MLRYVESYTPYDVRFFLFLYFISVCHIFSFICFFSLVFLVSMCSVIYLLIWAELPEINLLLLLLLLR